MCPGRGHTQPDLMANDRSKLILSIRGRGSRPTLERPGEKDEDLFGGEPRAGSRNQAGVRANRAQFKPELPVLLSSDHSRPATGSRSNRALVLRGRAVRRRSGGTGGKHVCGVAHTFQFHLRARKGNSLDTNERRYDDERETCTSRLSDSVISTYSWMGDFNRAATAAVAGHFDRIDDLLFDQDEDSVSNVNQREECREWSTLFPHLRIRGVELAELKRPSSQAMSPRGSALDHRPRLFQNGQPVLTSAGSLVVEGIPLRVPDLLLPSQDLDDGNSEDVFIDEVIVSDGVVEEYIAYDNKQQPVRKSRQQSGTGGKQRVGHVHNSVKLSVLSELVDVCITEMRTMTVSLAERLIRRRSQQQRKGFVTDKVTKGAGKRLVRPPLQHVSLDDFPMSPQTGMVAAHAAGTATAAAGTATAAVRTQNVNLQQLITIRSCSLQQRTGSTTQLVPDGMPRGSSRGDGTYSSLKTFTASKAPVPGNVKQLLEVVSSDDPELTPVAFYQPMEDYRIVVTTNAAPSNVSRFPTESDVQRPATQTPGYSRMQGAAAAVVDGLQDRALALRTPSNTTRPPPNKKRGLLKPLERARTPHPAQVGLDVTGQGVRGHKIHVPGRDKEELNIFKKAAVTTLSARLTKTSINALSQGMSLLEVPDLHQTRPLSTYSFASCLSITGLSPLPTPAASRKSSAFCPTACSTSKLCHPGRARQSACKADSTVHPRPQLNWSVDIQSPSQQGQFIRNALLPPMDASGNSTRPGGETPPVPRQTSAKSREPRVHFAPGPTGTGGDEASSARPVRAGVHDRRPNTIHGVREMTSSTHRKTSMQDLQMAMHIQGKGTASSTSFLTGAASGSHGNPSRLADGPQRAFSPAVQAGNYSNIEDDEDENLGGLGSGQLWIQASPAPVGSPQRHHRTRHK